jgi:hypothetical protein
MKTQIQQLTGAVILSVVAVFGFAGLSAQNFPQYADSILATVNKSESESKNRDDDGDGSVRISLCSAVPLGNLQNAFAVAPLAGIGFDYPIENGRGIVAELKVGPTVGRKPFVLDELEDSKTTFFINLSLYYSFIQCRLSSNLSLRPYFGAGLSILSTNQVEYYNEDDEAVRYSLIAFDLFGGAQLQYKRWGVFCEYHRTTLPMSSKISNDFGNAYLNIGIVFTTR